MSAIAVWQKGGTNGTYSAHSPACCWDRKRLVPVYLAVLFATTFPIMRPLLPVDRALHEPAGDSVLLRSIGSEGASVTAAVILAAFYLATSVYIASHRLFWFDELFIVRIAQLPTITAMWHALAHASDTMPPGYHLVARVVGRLLGYSELSMRLPSALAMVAGLLLVFDCTRRVTDGRHGLIAFSFLTCSVLPFYGYEARPYAFYFLLSALAIWLWVCIPENTGWSAACFGAVLCVAVTMHYYAVLCIVPYALWEVVNWRSGLWPSRKLLAGMAGVALATALVGRLAISYSRQFGSTFWASPSFFGLRVAFAELFPSGLFLFALLTLWIVIWRLRDRSVVVAPREPVESLGWLFIAIPLLGFLLAELKTNAFLIRYFIGVLPGIAIAFSSLLSRHFHSSRWISAGVLVLFVAWGGAEQWSVVEHPDRIDPFGQQTATRRYLQTEPFIVASGKQFILFDDAMLHMEARHYSRHPEECILLLRKNGLQYIPTVGIQANLSQYSPARLWQIDDLKQHARETVLINPAPDTLQAMREAGFRTFFQFPKPVEIVFFQ